METSLFDQGLALMLVGMGTVFVFLTILVLAMTAMSTIAMRFKTGISTDVVADEEVAAITVAIAQHRKKR